MNDQAEQSYELRLALSSSHAAACGSIFSFANSLASANMFSCSSVKPYAVLLLSPSAAAGVLKKLLIVLCKLLAGCCCKVCVHGCAALHAAPATAPTAPSPLCHRTGSLLNMGHYDALNLFTTAVLQWASGCTAVRGGRMLSTCKQQLGPVRFRTSVTRHVTLLQDVDRA